MSPAARRRLAVIAGGAGGSLVRIVVDDGVSAGPAAWPWATLLVNVTGALALGYLVARVALAARPDSLSLPLLGTGFLGALTTFSALSLEVHLLGDAGRPGTAAAYAVVSVVAGLTAALGGVALAGRRP